MDKSSFLYAKPALTEGNPWLQVHKGCLKGALPQRRALRDGRFSFGSMRRPLHASPSVWSLLPEEREKGGSV